MFDGAILINKKKYITSNKVLSLFKNKTGIKKAGIFGILDPLASGALPIIFGQATKYIPYLLNDKKTYNIESKLGVFSDCGDYEIEPKVYRDEQKKIKKLTKDIIEKTLNNFLGDYLQTPPMYSASKYKGKPLYVYARNNVIVKRNEKKRYLYNIKFNSLDNDILKFNVTCSSGTYIRTLIQDISDQWGIHSCLFNLKRLSVEPFQKFKSIEIDDIGDLSNQKNIIDISTMLDDLPEIICSDEEVEKLHHGLIVRKENIKIQQYYKIICGRNIFHGVGFFKDDHLCPKRMMKR